jgi:hypothetical protein
MPTPNGTASRGSRCSSRVRIAPVPAANASTIPGTKWWMWRRPTRTLRNGPTVLRFRSRYVTARAVRNVPTNELSRLNIAFSRQDPSR